MMKLYSCDEQREQPLHPSSSNRESFSKSGLLSRTPPEDPETFDFDFHMLDVNSALL